MKEMVHLHVHGTYSFLDGYNKADRAIARIKELGMKAIALTDHNALSGILDWQKECKAQDIKFIPGLEAYWTWDTNVLSLPAEERHEIALRKANEAGIEINPKAKKSDIKDLIAPYTYDTKQYHVILLAINQTGWNNLIKLQSEASDKCTYNGRYCCDNDLLRKYNEGLIMTTACVNNVVPYLINDGKAKQAKDMLRTWKEIFGDRLYLEIQPLNIDKQHLTNYYYMQWSKELDIKCIATTDSHYTLKEDHDDHDTLLCVGIGKKKADPDRMHYANEFWLKSYDEMVEGFETQYVEMNAKFPEYVNAESYNEFFTEALSNTNLIADMLQPIKIGSDKPLLPQTQVPKGLTAEEYLTIESYKGLYKYKNKKKNIDLPNYEKRLQYELSVINNKGYAPYMLIVKDLIDFCESEDIPVGPGRGSAAGSLCLFTNGITKCIDPIEYNLLFFRFLTPDRTALPDIDTDFAYSRRGDVIRHLEDVYGQACVSHIGTFSELGVKSGLKDVGRVLDMDFGIMNNLSRAIDEISNEDPNTTFKSLDKLKNGNEREQASWRQFDALEKQYPQLFSLARKFEGIPRNAGVHASGILVTPIPVTDIVPTRTADDGTKVALYTGTQLEELGLVKLDILGLKTLDVLNKTCKMIDPNMTVQQLYDIVEENMDDELIYEMIRGKHTDGLFQIESNLFKGMIEDIQPTGINDLIVINSLGRPGPLSIGMPQSYAKRKRGDEEATEPLKGTWHLVEDTLGTLCYQEQIMLIAQVVAGFDDNQADSYLRKATAKKKQYLMDLCRRWFIYGKKNESIPEGYDNDNINCTMYDPTGKYGNPIPGGIANRYDEKDLIKFWEDISNFCTYLFNKSHSACYAFVLLCTAFLKKHHTSKFLAALLTMQNEQEKIEKYIKVAKGLDINVKAPDINNSGNEFLEIDGEILYGLSSIKGVGGPSVEEIIKNRPYTDLEDAINRIPKKQFNKRVGIALIKAGAFESFDENRYSLMNQFYTVRKDKDDLLSTANYTEDICIAFEKEVLGCPITYAPFWDSISTNEIVEGNITLTDVNERADKNGNMMGFIECTINKSPVRAICFARTYCANADLFDMKLNTEVKIKGFKDDRGTLVIQKVIRPSSNNVIEGYKQKKKSIFEK